MVSSEESAKLELQCINWKTPDRTFILHTDKKYCVEAKVYPVSLAVVWTIISLTILWCGHFGRNLQKLA